MLPSEMAFCSTGIHALTPALVIVSLAWECYCILFYSCKQHFKPDYWNQDCLFRLKFLKENE